MLKLKIIFLSVIIYNSCNLINNNEKEKFFFQKGEYFFNSCQYFKAAVNYRNFLYIHDSLKDSVYFHSLFRLFYCYYRLNQKSELDSTFALIDKFYSQQLIDEIEYLRCKVIYLISLQNNYSKAIPLIKEIKAKSHKFNLNDYYFLGVCYERLNNIDSAYIVINEAVNKAETLGVQNNYLLSYLYSLLANYAYYYNNDFSKADILFNKMHTFMDNAFVTDSDHYAWNQYSYAVYLHHKGHISRANELYEKALKLYYNLQGKYDYEIATILMSQATVDIYLGKYTTAITKAKQAISIFNMLNERYSLSLAKLLLANCYHDYKQYEKALNEYFNTFYLIQDNLPIRHEVEFLIGRCYEAMHKYDSANFWYNKSINILLKNKNRALTASCYYSNFLNKIGKSKDALVVLNNYSNQNKQTSAIPILQQLTLMKHYAQCYYMLNDYKNALNYYNKALSIIQETNKTQLQFEISDFTIINEVIDLFMNKGIVIEKVAGNNIQKLQESLSNYYDAMHFAEKYRKFLVLESDKLSFNELKSVIYERIFNVSIQLSSLLASTAEKNKFLNIAFSASDRLKANVLTEQIIDNTNKIISQIPDSMIIKSQQISQDILFLINTINEENKSTHPKQNLIKHWQNLIIEKIEELESLEYYLEKNYHDYKILQNQQRNTISLENIQSVLSENSNLIYYQWVENNVHVFLVNKQRYFVHTISDNDIFDHVEFILQHVSSPPLVNNLYHQNFISFVNHAYSLYTKILKPFIPYLLGNNIIIVPDKMLSYLPFEILLDSTIFYQTVDYASLPYLIKKFNISYAYSAELLLWQLKNQSSYCKGVFAFAPKYENSYKNDSSNFVHRIRQNLIDIPGAQDEVVMIKKIMGAKLFTGNQANEYAFKSIIDKNRIIHLAMHAIVDDEHPMSSKLIFSQGKDSLNDGFLNVYEIYNLKFSTPLVVLSACNTGYGKLMQGEGIYSLTRGFVATGIPSLMFTLWQIADNTSKYLMEYFYLQLKNKQPLDFCLRVAKLQYLQNANSQVAHPYYWAAYCLVGKTTPIRSVESYHHTIFFLSILIIFCSIITIIVLTIKNQ